MRCLHHCKHYLAHSERLRCPNFYHASLKLVFFYLCVKVRKRISVYPYCSLLIFEMKRSRTGGLGWATRSSELCRSYPPSPPPSFTFPAWSLLGYLSVGLSILPPSKLDWSEFEANIWLKLRVQKLLWMLHLVLAFIVFLANFFGPSPGSEWWCLTLFC